MVETSGLSAVAHPLDDRLDLTSGANLSGIVTHDVLAPLAIAWLLIVLVLGGLMKLAQHNAEAAGNIKSEDEAE